MTGLKNTYGRTVRPPAGEAGFTLVELIVVMGIFVTLMLITSETFKTIANQSSQQSKSLETQIEGIVGLEVFRVDLEQIGFGLPWAFPVTISYSEASLDASTKPAANYWPSGSGESFNDSPGDPPRAVLSGNTKFNYDSNSIGASYLVIKSTATATNDSAKKWTSVAVNASGGRLIRTWNNTARDLQANDRVIVIKNNLSATPPTRELLAPSSTRFSAKFAHYSVLTNTVASRPVREGDTFQVYGVAAASTTYPEQVRMPFNRTDYFITAGNVPAGCAPNTGVLYKASIDQSPSTTSGGGYNPIIPLLDCVADMQVVYGVGSAGSSAVSLHEDTTNFMARINGAADKAGAVRDQLKEIRVYILAQDGKKDLLYNYPSRYVAVGESFDGGTTLLGRQFDLQTLIGSGWNNYRWKVYALVVRPKNLIQ